MQTHVRDTKHVAAAHAVPGVHHAIVAKSDVDAGGQEFGHAGHAAAFGVAVVAALQGDVDQRIGNHADAGFGDQWQQPTRRMSIGSAAARSRDELEKFEEKERRRKEAVKKETELLECQVSQLESQARQAVKAENLKEEKGLSPVGRDHVESSASSRHDRRTGHTIGS